MIIMSASLSNTMSAETVVNILNTLSGTWQLAGICSGLNFGTDKQVTLKFQFPIAENMNLLRDTVFPEVIILK